MNRLERATLSAVIIGTVAVGQIGLARIIQSQIHDRAIGALGNQNTTPLATETPIPTRVPLARTSSNPPIQEGDRSCGQSGGKAKYYSEAADPRAGFGERGFEWALFEGTANDYSHQRISGYYIGNDGCYYPIGTPASEKNK